MRVPRWLLRILWLEDRILSPLHEPDLNRQRFEPTQGAHRLGLAVEPVLQAGAQGRVVGGFDHGQVGMRHGRQHQLQEGFTRSAWPATTSVTVSASAATR